MLGHFMQTRYLLYYQEKNAQGKNVLMGQTFHHMPSNDSAVVKVRGLQWLLSCRAVREGVPEGGQTL